MPIDIKTPVQSAGLQGVELVRQHEKKISPSPLSKIVEIVLSEKNFVISRKLFRDFARKNIFPLERPLLLLEDRKIAGLHKRAQ